MLTLAATFLLRATSYLPDATTQTAQGLPASETPAPTEAPVEVMLAEVTPHPELVTDDTPPEDFAGIVFSDDESVAAALATQPAPTPTVEIVMAAPTAASTPMPTVAPGTWDYDNGSIAVHITRQQKDAFVYFAADIQLTSASQFSYAFSNEKYDAHTEALSDIAARHNPLVAINGDYYSFHNNGIIIRGGESFRTNKSTRHLLAVEANGDLTVVTDRTGKQAALANDLLSRGVIHTFEFGPVLVKDSKAVKLDSSIVRVGKGYLEPRTAIGQLGPLHYLVIVVDGRSDGYSEGCDLPTLQQLFLDHGVTTAFNLDGGGSTTLWYDGNVINQPASGDERKVSDIVMFMR